MNGQKVIPSHISELDGYDSFLNDNNTVQSINIDTFCTDKYVFFLTKSRRKRLIFLNWVNWLWDVSMNSSVFYGYIVAN